MKQTVNIIEISIETFVMKMFKELSGFNHIYKETVYGCIEALRYQYQNIWVCKESNDTIYEKFKEVWWALQLEGKI